MYLVVSELVLLCHIGPILTLHYTFHITKYTKHIYMFLVLRNRWHVGENARARFGARARIFKRMKFFVFKPSFQKCLFEKISSDFLIIAFLLSCEKLHAL